MTLTALASSVGPLTRTSQATPRSTTVGNPLKTSMIATRLMSFSRPKRQRQRGSTRNALDRRPQAVRVRLNARCCPRMDPHPTSRAAPLQGSEKPLRTLSKHTLDTVRRNSPPARSAQRQLRKTFHLSTPNSCRAACTLRTNRPLLDVSFQKEHHRTAQSFQSEVRPPWASLT